MTESHQATDAGAYAAMEAAKMRKMWAASVLLALNDFIAEQRRHGDGIERCGKWAMSRDGRTVLSCAGINPDQRVADSLMAFVASGVRTTISLRKPGGTNRNEGME